MKKIYIIRHAEDRRDSEDPRLSKVGKEQVYQLRGKISLPEEGNRATFCSWWTRAFDTAVELGKSSSVISIAGLNENGPLELSRLEETLNIILEYGKRLDLSYAIVVCHGYVVTGLAKVALERALGVASENDLIEPGVVPNATGYSINMETGELLKINHD